MTLTFALIITLYMGVIFYLGYRGYKGTKTATDYLLAGRKAHPAVMALSYGATFISTSAIVGFSGLSARFGTSMMVLTFLNIAVGIFIAFIWIGKRTRRMGHHLDAHTFPELIGKRYRSPFIQKFSGWIIFIFMPLYSATVLIGGARFLEETFQVNFNVALLIFTVVIAAYVITGGLRGVMYTEALQGAIMIIGMLILTIVAYVSFGGVTTSHAKLGKIYKEVKERVATPESNERFIREYLNSKFKISIQENEITALKKQVEELSKVSDEKARLLAFSNYLRDALPELQVNQQTMDAIWKRFYYSQVEMQELGKGGLEKLGFRGWDETPEAFSIFWWILYSTFVLGVGIGVLAQPQLAVRFMTVKSNRELNRAVAVGGIFIMIIIGSVYIVGPLTNLFFYNHPDYNTISFAAAGGNVDKVMPLFINLSFPKWFVFIFMLTLLSAAMSTVASQFHAIGTAVSRDIYQRKNVDPLEMDQKSVFWSKIGIVIGIVITVILGYILGAGVIARGTAIFFGLTAASFLPAFVAGLYFKNVTKAAAATSIVSGFSVSLIWMVFFQVKPASALGLCQALFGKPSLVAGTKWAVVDPIILGLPVAILALIVVSFFSRKFEKDHVDYCFQGIKSVK